MLNVRDQELAIRTPQKPSIRWTEEQTLSGLIASQFPTSPADALLVRGVRLDPSFTVVNMIKICGLQVRWTESLEDHLRLDRRAKVLSIFSQKDFLSGHMQSGCKEVCGHEK